MNERIKELAEQAGLVKEFTITGMWLADDEELEHFAELIRADERDKCAKDYLQDCADAVKDAKKDEREACAALCEEYVNSSSDHEAGTALIIQENIRARSEK
jgi:hypothetical protein